LTEKICLTFLDHPGIEPTDTVKHIIDSFLYSPFSKISPQCNIPNGNQRDESWVLVCFSYRNSLGEISWQVDIFNPEDPLPPN
jgi:hypothetical protein